jgi:uncharacterized protein YgbK (DUF1537 family)
MEKLNNDRLLITFYGDDFTGSTDALESLTNAGIKTMLFIECPTPKQLTNYPNLQAIGIAGMSRSFSPQEMEDALPVIFNALKALSPKHVHYKVCSTFDSSPIVGSIGKAIDIGAEVFKTAVVPLVVAAPILGRYCLFGNLFAQMGIGSDGKIFRLDRHPSMSKHPTTPADESDLRLHLAKQTNKKIGLFSILELQQYQNESYNIDFSAHEIVLFDALKQEDLTTLGKIIDLQSTADHIVFSAGSSGIGMALGGYWKENGLLEEKPIKMDVKSEGPILVASGSCSAVTAAQINFALQNGFAEIPIDTVSLAEQIFANDFSPNSELMLKTVLFYANQASVLIKQGKSVIIHTSLGNTDERVLATDQVFKQRNFYKAITAKLYGNLLGLIVRSVAETNAIERIIIAGGDTSSYAARAMGIEAVEMMAPLSPGAPICLAHASGSPIDQLQIVFKGGQVGKEDFFTHYEKFKNTDN